MTKIKVPNIQEPKESKKVAIPPIFVVTILILSSILGVFYFHGIYNMGDFSSKYNKNWFERNNRAKLPPNLEDIFKNLNNLTGLNDLLDDFPELNTPENILAPNVNRIDFYVLGHVPPLVWKLTAFSEYVEGEGWKLPTVEVKEYSPITVGYWNFSFYVIKENISVDTSETTFMITLWSLVDIFSAFDLEILNVKSNKTGVSVNSEMYRDVKTDAFVAAFSSSDSCIINVRYRVRGNSINRDFISSRSDSIGETRIYVSGVPELQYFTQLPKNYANNHPIFKNLANRLYLGDDASVFEQVKRIVTYFTIYFNVTDEKAPRGVDPVDWFISNRAGDPAYFVYAEALILRYYGIPARVAVGYIYGEYNASLGATVFNPAKHMFIWLEVFDSGVRRWIPFNGLPISLPEEPLNLIDLSFKPEIYLFAPRVVQGIPSVYLNETFIIEARIPGVYDTSVFKELVIYDENESAVIGRVPFSVEPDGLSATFASTFEVIYASLGREPLYGKHILTIYIGKFKYFVVIALLNRVVISP